MPDTVTFHISVKLNSLTLSGVGNKTTRYCIFKRFCCYTTSLRNVSGQWEVPVVAICGMWLLAGCTPAHHSKVKEQILFFICTEPSLNNIIKDNRWSSGPFTIFIPVRRLADWKHKQTSYETGRRHEAQRERTCRTSPEARGVERRPGFHLGSFKEDFDKLSYRFRIFWSSPPDDLRLWVCYNLCCVRF